MVEKYPEVEENIYHSEIRLLSVGGAYVNRDGGGQVSITYVHA